MQRGLKLQNYKITRLQNPQRGYMLITLMLALALITIGLLTVLPEIGQQIRRDREEEMRHRGTAYMRAIQHFYRKFGRYPMRVEELENTNNIRFLRKRYKDPINRDPATGHERDFKLLHQTDISLNNGPLLAPTPGPQQPGAGTPPPAPSVDPSNPSPSNPPDTGGDPNSPGSSHSGSSPFSSNPSSNSGSGFNGPTFGGGPILGVASTSKAKSIRVFYEKNHYNDWLFIYVSQADRGGLLTGPVSLNGPAGNLGFSPGQLPAPGPGTSPITSQPQSVPTQSPQNANSPEQ
jgi:type II secretory pathway pseudopilin PulG